MALENLIVFKKSFSLAMEIYHMTKYFPGEEKFSLIDQVRRSSRSVSANIGEGYRKKVYPKSFVAKMVDADGECTETIVHLMFAKECGYINEETFQRLNTGYAEVGRILGAIINKPDNFTN